MIIHCDLPQRVNSCADAPTSTDASQREGEEERKRVRMLEGKVGEGEGSVGGGAWEVGSGRSRWKACVEVKVEILTSLEIRRRHVSK